MQELLLPSGALLGLVLLRAAPVVVYIAISRHFSALTKYIVLVAAGLWLLFTLEYDPLATDLVVYGPVVFAYFGSVVALSIVVRGLLLRWGKGAAFGMLLALFVAAPAALPLGALRPFAIASGWEMLLASFSVSVDGYGDGRGPTFAEHAFFVLVNPVLVYAERGRVTRRFQPSALLRCLLGAIVLYCGASLSRAAGAFSIEPLRVETAFVCAVLFLAAYAKHSGLASLQIGFMRFTGHEISERYLFPLSATNPVEFWQRWNTYVGSWARRYLFGPMALWFARKLPPNRRSMQGLAAIGTFAIIGLLHDAAAMLTTQRLSWRWLVFFLWHALALIAWRMIRPTAGVKTPASGRASVVHRAFAWAMTMMILLSGAFLMAAIVMPR